MVQKYLRVKQQIRNLAKQLDELTAEKSEKMLDISLIDNDLENLAGTLNQYIRKQRQNVARTLQHEEYLKESVANISHDLRTPLTVILGYMQLLQKESLTEEQAQRIDIVRNKAQRMKELVQNFYDISVLDTAQIIPRPEKFCVSNMLIDILSENVLALENKNLVPDIKLPDHSVYLFSDRGMIERIIQNLLTNAIRYSVGTIQIRLTQKADGGICFVMQNPVAPGAIPDPGRLFERFYTGDSARNNGSTGLGLAVVKELTQKVGGTVSAFLEGELLQLRLEISCYII